MALLVKTVSGLAIASVKTVQGLAVGSAKTIMGLDNTAGGGSCPVEGSPNVDVPVTNDDENNVSFNADRFYVGQKSFSDASERTICRIGFYMVPVGTITDKFFRAAIYSVSGNNLGSVITNGYSDELAGFSTSGWKYFTFSGTLPILAASTAHHIVCYSSQSGSTTPAAADSTNRARIWADAPSVLAGNNAVWSTAGVIDVDSTGHDCNIRLYYFA